MKSTVFIFLILLIALPAASQDYLPLEPGNFWSYLLDDGSHELRVVGEMVPVFGNMVYPIGHPFLDPFQNLVNYWSTGPDGDLLLWGWSRGTFGYLYQPPIVVVDSPLSLGKEWSTTAGLYAVTDSSYVQTGEFPFIVCDHADINVPAGAFDSWGVGYGPPPAKTLFDGRYNVMGEEIGAKTGEVERWYAEDVGVVEEYLTEVYQLETFTGHPVATETSTWGGIKALFRGNQ